MQNLFLKMERWSHLGLGFFLDVPWLTVLLPNSSQRKFSDQSILW